MPGFTLRQLEYLAAIAETGSLAAASRELHTTPGTLSAAITDLEKALRIQVLVRRRAKGAGLTPAGHQLIAGVRGVLSAASALTSAAGSIRGELVGALRIGCFTPLSPWLVPPVLDFFATNHPDVDIHLHEDSSVELQKMLHEGSLDACFMYRLHISSALEQVTVAPARLQLVLPADHRLATSETVRLAELRDDSAALLGLRPAADLVEAMTSAVGFHPNVRWRSTSVETIRSIVGRGLGYSILMGRPYGDLTYEGKPLAYRRIEDPLPENSVELVYTSGAMVNAKVRALADFSRSELHGGPHGSPVTGGRPLEDLVLLQSGFGGLQG